MSTPAPDRNPVELLAEEFRQRLRKGENPDLAEYTQKYPQLADEIRELFPALVMMERLRPAATEATGTYENVLAPSAGPALERLGDYRILREIGRGGMGIVYEAEQESLGRRVALKVLPSTTLLDPRHQKRFLREARAAARLHHTHIVPVYGVGEQDGMHYYVMQFIQGLGLDDVLTELKRLHKTGVRDPGGAAVTATRTPGGPARNTGAAEVARSLLTGAFPQAPRKDGTPGDAGVPTEAPAGKVRVERVTIGPPGSGESDPTVSLPAPAGATGPVLSDSGRHFYQSVAEIGIQVAEALDYAASQGILHRDIKPSNLLLDTQGNVWVTDFGLAKATADEDNLTHTGDIVGTLRYMAPERYEGQSDIRADIYSLGLTLYELLVRRPAYEETDRNKLIHQVTTQEPPPPRRVNPAVPRDLETIVLKAIARDPARRYQAPGELAADLKRFLEDRPIRARRAGLAERFWRWCRRNPAVAGLTAGIVGLLVFLALASSVAAVHFGRLARQEAEARQDAEDARKREADQRRGAEAARRTAEQNRDEAERQRARAEANFAQARAAVDDYLTKISENQLLNVPGLQPLRRRLLTSALVFYKDFLKKRGKDPGLRAALAEAQFHAGQIYQELGEADEGRKTLQEARDLFEPLARQNPKDARLQAGLARCYMYLADYPRAIATWEKALRLEPKNALFQKELAETFNTLATRQMNDTSNSAALQAHRRALALRAEIVRHDPDNPEARLDLGATLNNLGVILYNKGRTEEALALYRRAVEHAEAAFARAPEVVKYGRYLAIGYGNVGRTERKLGRTEEALHWYEKSLAVWRRLARENPAVASLHSSLFHEYRNLALYQRELGRRQEAANSLRLAREVLERLPRQTPADLYNLACAQALSAEQIGQGTAKLSPEDLAERRRLEDQAVDALRRAVGAGFRNLDLVRSNKDLNGLRRRVDFQNLVTALEKELEAGPARPAVRVRADKQKAAQAALANRADLAAGDYAIGLALAELDQPEAAAQSLARALEQRQALVHDEPANLRHPVDLGLTYLALGQLHWKAGRRAEALRSLQKGLEAFAPVVATRPTDPRLTDPMSGAYFTLYQTFARERLWKEAAQYLGKSVDLDPANHWKRYLLASLLLQAGEVKEYHRRSREMLAQFGDTKDPMLAERTAKACLLVPASDDILTKAAGLADRAAGDPSHWIIPYARVAQGLAAFRRGRWEEAITPLKSVLTRPLFWGAELPARLVLAMAHHKAGHAMEARQELTRADELFGKLNDPVNNAPGVNQHDWLIGRLLRREAHQLIEGKAPPEDPAEHLHRGLMYAQFGSKEEAEKELQAAVAVRPDDPTTLIARAEVFAELGWKDRADADLARGRDLLARAPSKIQEDAALWRALARALRKRGRHAEAADAYHRALDLQRKRTEAVSAADPAWETLGELYDRLADEDRAAGHADQAGKVLHEREELWERHGVQPLRTFRGHTSTWVESVVALPDGRRALSCSYDDTIRLWDLATGKELRRFRHDGSVRCLAVAADGRRFLSASHDLTVRLWDIDTGKEIRRFVGHTGGVLAVAFLPDGRRAVSGGSDNVIRLWDLETGKELGQLKGHTAAVLDLAVTPDGRRLVSSGGDWMVRLWDLETLKELRSFPGHRSRVWRVDVSPDGRRALSGGDGGRLILWDLEAGKEIRRWDGKTDWGIIRAVRFLPDGKRAMFGSWTGYLILVDVESGREVYRIKGPAGHSRIAMLPGGRVLTADGDKCVRLWSFPLTAPPEEAAVYYHHWLTALAGKPVLRGPLLDQAVRWEPLFARLAKLLPDDAELWGTRAAYHAAAGEPELAVAEYARAAELNQGDARWARRRDELRSGGIAAWYFDQGAEGWKALPPFRLTRTAEGLKFEGLGKGRVMMAPVKGPAGWKKLVVRVKSPGPLMGVVYWTTPLRTTYQVEFSQRFFWRGAAKDPGETTAYFFTAAPLTGLRLLFQDDGKGQEVVSLLLANVSDKEGSAGALTELTRSLEQAGPNDYPRLLLWRAFNYAGQGKWKEAAADFRTLVDKYPATLNLWWRQEACVTALLKVGDGEGFRKVRSRMLGQYGATTDPRFAAAVARSAVLAPLDEKELARLARLTGQPLRWEGVKAAVAYRAGNFAEARRLLAKSTEGLNEAAFVWALVCHRLGDAAGAREWLKKGNHQVEEGFARIRAGRPANESWQDWARLLIWQREAEEAIQGKKAGKG